MTIFGYLCPMGAVRRGVSLLAASGRSFPGREQVPYWRTQ